MILKQKAFQKLAQIMKLKENQEKKPHPGIEHEFNKSSVCMERNSSTPIPLGHIAVDIRSVIQCNLYSTSEQDKLVASKQRREIL